ncbi:alpha-1,2-fucosyltransferase [Foetidibacter luteolus]|uniref:alpha-1,2-fucosyltransferase n=1 Tax=Foetidibacter luteolus TaxID=2608880 RepID=UPI00129BDE2E|nr:alpha-1,2-fucosyltransferase [Foetidibacter luteolus]
MIVVRMIMGLGNQMFQYAAAKSLALEKNTSLMLDLSSYAGYGLRKYELENYFNIKVDVIKESQLSRYFYNHPVKRVWNKLVPGRTIRTLGLPYEEKGVPYFLLNTYDLLFPPYKRKTYQEPHYYFDEHFFQANEDVFLQGYWMSWRYFEKYKHQILEEFIMNDDKFSSLNWIVNEIESTNSVSIHIRRTDTVSPKVAEQKGSLSAGFYYEAVSYILSKVEDPVFYVFSDDIQWAKENLLIKNAKVYFISNNVVNTAKEDFYLMSKCRHSIIANSTFSWWAAYIGSQKDKLTIAPKKWMTDSRYNCKDIYPPEWILL